MRALLAAAPLALSGCLTFSRVYGARTLEPGQLEAGLALGVRPGDDPESLVPVPQGPLILRAGVLPDVDLGFKVYLLGLGTDVRWRFFHEGRWHLAVNPGLGAVFLPSLLNPTDFGALEATMPLLGEVELNRWLSVAGGAHLTFRDRPNLAADGILWRFDAYTGAGARLEAHPGVTVVGLYGDLVFVPTRYTGLPTWAAGLDVKFRTPTKEQLAARRARQAARKAIREGG